MESSLLCGAHLRSPPSPRGLLEPQLSSYSLDREQEKRGVGAEGGRKDLLQSFVPN